MLRKLVYAGAFAGLAASVPVLYENNPELVERLLAGRGGEAAPVVALAQPERRGEMASGRTVRLDADARGHFSGDFRLNGRTVPAMIDTGATVVAINETTARRIGLYLARADFTAAVETANGRAMAAPATIDRLEIGGIEVRDIRAVVLEDEVLTSTLVGMSFLSRLRRYQVESGTMVLEQ
ncbi:TIGR02281 family clan AA aspartic protease [Mesorhizobium sp. CAU 1741]|uniref:TIGR02281 family clan AA aspartic protease n=1 Tax=Mesorhizobium sp. CAU 1741 TaxID=3140366 RepID=UPI00325A993C